MRKIEFENGSIIKTLDLGESKPIRGKRAYSSNKILLEKCYCIECKKEWISEFNLEHEVLPNVDEVGARFICSNCINK